MMTNRFTLALLSAALLTLGACGKKEEPVVPKAAAPVAAPAGKWAELRVAIDPTYKPFTYKLPDGSHAGFDVDVAKALCDHVKAKCTFVEQDWDGMIPGLIAEKYDMIVSSMSITEERMKAVDFTGKYYNTPSCVVTKTALKLDGTPASFKGKKIGVLKGSTQEKFAMGELAPAGAKIVPYKAQDQVYVDIKAGRVDGTVADMVEVAGGFLSTDDGKAYSCAGGRIPVSYDAKYFGQGVGVALRKGQDELKKAMNEGIAAIRANGTWKQLAEKHAPGIDIWGE